LRTTIDLPACSELVSESAQFGLNPKSTDAKINLAQAVVFEENGSHPPAGGQSLQLREQLQNCTGFPFNPITKKMMRTKFETKVNILFNLSGQSLNNTTFDF